MLIQQQPACILHARPYRETSLLLECLTRDHGRVGMVARGVRRPRARLSSSMLQPFQQMDLGFSLRGELGTLRNAEPADRPLRLQGTALLAGMYVNELVVRLSARQDPQPGLYDTYTRTVGQLAGADSPGWTLRRFERDFLRILGYALQLECDADVGEPLVPDVEYVYIPEQGPVPASPGQRGARVRGADLLDFAADRKPDAAGLERLRRLVRALLLHQLGGVPLKSWQVFGVATRQKRRID
ncbi:MAG TPA: DNA repair protein RecO [Oleiagrimonas sp.]|nr:DNA repair protein RecO [Oleiagrimonas sp.]